MEATTEVDNKPSMKEDTNPQIPINVHIDVEGQIVEEPEKEIDYSQRGQWLRAGVLGASDGLVSTASLMIGVGAVQQDVASMIISGFAGMIAGACSMAIGEFVSVYSQRDIEVSQMKRESDNRIRNGGELSDEDERKKERLPNPLQAAAVSALSFIIGALVPLLGAAFISVYGVRLGVMIAVSSLALVMFGWVSAVLGKAPVKRSCFRVLVGGWFAMAITYGLSRLIGLTGF